MCKIFPEISGGGVKQPKHPLQPRKLESKHVVVSVTVALVTCLVLWWRISPTDFVSKASSHLRYSNSQATQPYLRIEAEEGAKWVHWVGRCAGKIVGFEVMT